MDTLKNILIQIPEPLHRSFKIKLAAEGRTQKSFLITVIQTYVKKDQDEKKEDKHKKTD